MTQTAIHSVFLLDSDLCIVRALNNRQIGSVPVIGLALEDFILANYSDCIDASAGLVDVLTASILRDFQGVLMWPRRATDQSMNVSHLRLAWHQMNSLTERQWILSLDYIQAADHRFTTARDHPVPAQKEFINQLVHELRTPLAIASGSLKRVGIQAPSLKPAAREHLSVAEQELRRIRRLVDHLSLLTDVETGSKRWTLALETAGVILSTWKGRISSDLRERLICVPFRNVLDHFVYVAADALEVIIDNLCDNAMRYGTARSPVVLLLTCGGQLLNFYVADWGSGIPEKQREHVFDPFRRLEEHRDPALADGSGLGLSVCRSLVEMMHGSICILPAVQGLGLDAALSYPKTVVKVSLPLLSVNDMQSSSETGIIENDLASNNHMQSLGLSQSQSEGLLAYLKSCGDG